MKKTLTILMLLITLTTLQGQDLIISNDKKITWGKENKDDVSLDLAYKATVKPNLINIGLASQIGTKFMVFFKDLNVAVDLAQVITFKGGFDEGGDLAEGFLIQVSTHDFDNDKNPEIIIAVGNNLGELYVNVIKYHPPEYPKDAIKSENWTVIADFEGQQNIQIEKNIITIPYGSQGLFFEYTYVNDKFIQTVE
jgi:hypothetical protein